MEGTGVGGHKDGASSEAEEHETDQFQGDSGGNGKERVGTEEEEGEKERGKARYADSPGSDV